MSSDSDFTRLACRLKESGLFVYGFGRKQTPTPFQKACDKFTYTETLGGEDSGTTSGKKSSSGEELVQTSAKNGRSKKEQETNKQEESDKTVSKAAKLQQNKKLINLLKRAYEASSGEDGLANLGAFGSQISKISPSFDSRNYEYSKLGSLIRDIGLFEVQEVTSESNPVGKVLYIKLRS